MIGQRIVNNILGTKPLYEETTTSTDIVLYKDESGNTINKKFIKTRNRWQFYAKNAKGQLINSDGFNELINKSGLDTKLNIKLKSDGKGIKKYKY